MHADEPSGLASEAARYAVLRRVGPALRHDLIVNLQAVAMMTEVITARLDRGLPPLADLQHHLGRIQRATREAVADSLRVATWLSPPEDDRIDLRDGMQECVALVRSGLEYRGFPVRTELPGPGFEVSRAWLRPLLLCALMHLSDLAPARGELVVGAQTDSSHATVLLRRMAQTESTDLDDGSTPDPDIPYRPMQTQDLQALAQAGACDLHVAQDLVALRFARLVPTTPLQIAPH